MFSQYRSSKNKECYKSLLINDISSYIQKEIQNNEENIFEPIISLVMSKLQPWILTVLVIFGLYFILILAILILILRNDIKK